MSGPMRLDQPARPTSSHRQIRVVIPLAVALLALLPATHAQQPVRRVPAEYSARVSAAMRNSVARRSGMAMVLMTRMLGMSSVRGKPMNPRPDGHPWVKPEKLRDVGIGVHPTRHENQPTIVGSPTHQQRLVAGSHSVGPPGLLLIRCVAYRSLDGGTTWSTPVAMPQLTATSQCSDPVLAYAPDGSRVYYAYMDIKSAFTDAPPTFMLDVDILVSYSDDDGATWIGPVVALNGAPTITVLDPPSVRAGFDYDKPWIATHADASQSAWVYVSATRSDEGAPFDCHVVFARSSSKAVAFGTPTLLDSSSGGCQSPVVVSGSRPSGGPGGTVLVAWYNSGSDGWLAGSFDIRVRASRDHGATFGPAATAAHDSFEVPFWLGPFGFYHRWWPVMFPDVEIDRGGEAHIAYAHDPAQGNDTAEEGDIRYVSSDGPPYRNWSVPITVNDDGLERAQGFAALEILHGGRSSSVHVIWEDHRLSPDVPVAFPQSPNLFYDIFHARKVPGALAFGRNQRVSDRSSLNDHVFVGDYIDLAASHRLFGIWTDRRDKRDIFDDENDVFGSRILNGNGRPHER
jgi:hypothetical protein